MLKELQLPDKCMNTTVLEFMERRRSVLARELEPPGPSSEQLSRLLTIAARVPDHGKLAPWRFIIIDGPERRKFGEIMGAIARQENAEISQARLEAECGRFEQAPVVVCVVSKVVDHPKIPEWEQILSAGAACQMLVTAATAMGFGAQWLTDWCAYHHDAHRALGLADGEQIAGFVHIGTAAASPSDRARPEMSEITSRWQSPG